MLDLRNIFGIFVKIDSKKTRSICAVVKMGGRVKHEESV